MRQIIKILFVATFLIANSGFSQENKDLETWSSIQLNYKMNKKWKFGLQQQLRLKNNSSETDQYFTQLTADYKLNKDFTLGGGMRYIKSNDNTGNIQGYEDHFRYHFDLAYKHKIDQFSLKYRVRFQNKNELGISESDGDYAKKTLRFKTSIGYDIKKWKFDPKFAAEIFHRTEEGEDSQFSKYRLTLGTDYSLKKYGKIGLYYRIEKELNESLPKTTSIIGLKYSYTFKK
jgi:hypothetical protein